MRRNDACCCLGQPAVVYVLSTPHGLLFCLVVCCSSPSSIRCLFSFDCLHCLLNRQLFCHFGRILPHLESYVCMGCPLSSCIHLSSKRGFLRNAPLLHGLLLGLTVRSCPLGSLICLSGFVCIDGLLNRALLHRRRRREGPCRGAAALLRLPHLFFCLVVRHSPLCSISCLNSFPGLYCLLNCSLLCDVGRLLCS